MGTKANPGKYDCYAKAAPDEPIFTLRGKDPSAPYLVRIWTWTRLGNVEQAHAALLAMLSDTAVQSRIGACEKFEEAFECASAMREWRKSL